MPRYTQWHHKRGDVVNAPGWLVDAGQKLLGRLAERRRLSGVKTMGATQTFPDGSRVRAMWFGDVPIVELYPATPTSQQLEEGFMEGFIVRPDSQNGATSPEESFLVMQPTTTTYFYDAPLLPSGSTDYVARLTSVDSSGKALFKDADVHPTKPYVANSLMSSGNIDWRNADETLLCTWFGPLCRYYGTWAGTPFAAAFVMFHGQVLFDCTALPGTLFPELDGQTLATDYGGATGVVTGACITTEAERGQVLLVFVRFGGQGSGFRVDYLVSVQVTSDDTRAVAGARASTWTLAAADGGGVVGNPIVRMVNIIDAATGDVGHPWFFNQAATQARCIRPQFLAGNVVECIVSLADGVWTYSEDVHAAGVVTTTTTTSDFDSTDASTVNFDVYTAVLPTGTCSPLHEISAGTTTSVAHVMAKDAEPGSSAIDPACYLGISTSGSVSEVRDADDVWTITAVDFRDNVPVYAYGRAHTYTSTATWSAEFTSYSYVNTMSVSGAWGSDFFVTETTDAASEYDRSDNFSLTGFLSGIKTDWITIETAESITSTKSGSRALTTHFDIEHRYNWNSGICGYDPTPDTVSTHNTASYVRGGNYSKTEYGERFYLLYLDLRFKWLSCRIDKSTITTSFPAFTDTTSLDSTENLNASQTTTVLTAYYVMLDADTLAATTAVKTPVVTSGYPGGIPTGFPMQYVPNPIGLLFAPGPPLIGYTGYGNWNGSVFTAPYGTPPIIDVPSLVGSCAADTAAMLPVVTTTTEYSFGTDYLFGPEPDSFFWAVITDRPGPPPGIFLYNHYGSWCSYKGHYAFSQAMPNGAPATAHYAYGIDWGNMRHMTNNDVNPTQFFHPISVLPRVKY